MKISFPKQPNAKIIQSIRQAMEGRSLNDLVSIEEQGSDVIVKISKLGTSVLTFKRTEDDGKDSVQLDLVGEKIAFAHKAFKDEVKLKFSEVIKKAGGIVT